MEHEDESEGMIQEEQGNIDLEGYYGGSTWRNRKTGFKKVPKIDYES